MKFIKIIILIVTLKINIVVGTTIFTDKIIAIVNHKIILDSDITNKINFIKYDLFNKDTCTFQKNRLYYTILDQLITDNLIFQIANKENIKIDSKQPYQIIEYAARTRNMTLDQFNIYLNNIGIKYDKYFLEIYQNMLKKFISNQISYQYNYISSNEINNIAQKLNFIDFQKQFKLTHILIELPIQASSIKINQSKKFAELLIKEKKTQRNLQNFIYSYYYKNNNLFSRTIIKNMGWMTWDRIPVIFDQYLNTAKPGDIIGPIYSYDGIHILEIEDINTNKDIQPIIKVKINDIISKDKSNNIYIQQELLKIKEQIENGDSTFNIILQEKSQDFYSENYGNFLKWIHLNQFDSSIQKVLLNLKKNQISMPIYTNNGWYLIKLIDFDKLNYSDIIYARAHSYILHQKFDENLCNWMQELKSKSYIKIFNTND